MFFDAVKTPSTPSTTTTNNAEYHIIGALLPAVRPPPVAAARLTFFACDALPIAAVTLPCRGRIAGVIKARRDGDLPRREPKLGTRDGAEPAELPLVLLAHDRRRDPLVGPLELHGIGGHHERLRAALHLADA